MSALLSRDLIVRLLEELDAELADRGVIAELYLIGGAAMVLSYDAREATRDVDAVFRPTSEIRAAASTVAKRHDGLDPDWLNDAAKGFLPSQPDTEAETLYSSEHLSILTASPRHLFALKAQAARISRDDDDLRFLATEVLRLSSIDEGLDIVEAVLGPGRLSAKQQYFVVEVLQEVLPQSRGVLPSVPQASARAAGDCGRPVAATELPCRLRVGHGGRCRSR